MLIKLFFIINIKLNKGNFRKNFYLIILNIYLYYTLNDSKTGFFKANTNILRSMWLIGTYSIEEILSAAQSNIKTVRGSPRYHRPCCVNKLPPSPTYSFLQQTNRVPYICHYHICGFCETGYKTIFAKLLKQIPYEINKLPTCRKTSIYKMCEFYSN